MTCGGPYVHTTLDPSLGTGTTVVADCGQTARRCKMTRTITWPDGRTQVDEFEGSYKRRWMVVRAGTATTTKPPATTTVATAAS